MTAQTVVRGSNHEHAVLLIGDGEAHDTFVQSYAALSNYSNQRRCLTSVVLPFDEAAVCYWLTQCCTAQRRAWLMQHQQFVGYVRAFGSMWEAWYDPALFPHEQQAYNKCFAWKGKRT